MLCGVITSCRMWIPGDSDRRAYFIPRGFFYCSSAFEYIQTWHQKNVVPFLCLYKRSVTSTEFQACHCSQEWHFPKPKYIYLTYQTAQSLCLLCLWKGAPFQDNKPSHDPSRSPFLKHPLWLLYAPLSWSSFQVRSSCWKPFFQKRHRNKCYNSISRHKQAINYQRDVINCCTTFDLDGKNGRDLKMQVKQEELLTRVRECSQSLATPGERAAWCNHVLITFPDVHTTSSNKKAPRCRGRNRPRGFETLPDAKQATKQKQTSVTSQVSWRAPSLSVRPRRKKNSQDENVAVFSAPRRRGRLAGRRPIQLGPGDPLRRVPPPTGLALQVWPQWCQRHEDQLRLCRLSGLPRPAQAVLHPGV